MEALSYGRLRGYPRVSDVLEDEVVPAVFCNTIEKPACARSQYENWMISPIRLPACDR